MTDYWNINDILAEAEVTAAAISHCRHSHCPPLLSLPPLTFLLSPAPPPLSPFLSPSSASSLAEPTTWAFSTAKARKNTSNTQPPHSPTPSPPPPPLPSPSPTTSLLTPPSSPSVPLSQLPANREVHLPFWAIPRLFLAHTLTFALPPIYHPSKNRSLLADPRHVDLSSHHFHYFALGLKLTAMAPSGRVEEQMRTVMDERYVEVVEKTQAMGGGGAGVGGLGMGGGWGGVGGGGRGGCVGGYGFLSVPGLRFSEKLECWEREVFAWKLLGLRGLERWKGQAGRMRVKEGRDMAALRGGGMDRKRTAYADANASAHERNKRRRG